MPDDGDRMLTVDEAAERMNVKPHYVRRLIFEKRIPVMKLTPGKGGAVRIVQSDLDAYLQACRVEAAQ